ncbi:MAG: undecaprenyl-diphosphate phosphatase [Candidatus Omnitrophota bacterium]
MVLWQALVLGIVQGITEFLPVSSSGHLVLFQSLFGMKEPMLAFDVALHAGTLVALLVYFRKEIGAILAGFLEFLKKCSCPCACSASSGDRSAGLWFMILLTLIPTAVIAVLFKDYFENAFSDLASVGWQWIIMGVLLLLSVKIPEGTRRFDRIGWWRSLLIGLAQALALIPAISRSGSTILAGMALGIKREDAAKFSFLISIPAIIGAVLLELKHGAAYFASHENEVLAGFLASALSGYMVIKWLMGIIQRGRFSVFGYYCLLAGCVSLGIAYLSR